MQDRERGLVHGHHLVVGIERDEAVARALEDAVVVVLHVEYVIEELRVFDRDRDLRGECAEPRFVLGGEEAAVLVEDLRHTDSLARLAVDGHAQDALGLIAGAVVDLGVEPGVGIGVGYDLDLTGSEHLAGDSVVGGEADLGGFHALGESRPQLVRLRVVDEDRRAVGIEELGGGAHDPLEQGIEVDLARELVGDLEDAHLLAQARGHQVEAAEEVGVLVGARDLEVVVKVALLDSVHGGDQLGRRSRDLGRGQDRHRQRQAQAHQDDAHHPHDERRHFGDADAESQILDHQLDLQRRGHGQEQERQRGDEDRQVQQLVLELDRDQLLQVIGLDLVAMLPQTLDGRRDAA